MAVYGGADARGQARSRADELRARAAGRLRQYRAMEDWYEGRHWKRARNGRTSLTLNYGRVVVDKGVAYLLGRGLNFAVPPRREGVQLDRQRAERAEQLLYDTYWDNDLDEVDHQVATNAATVGDGVYKVWWDVLERRIRVLSVDPYAFHARWAGDDPSRVLQVEVAYALDVGELDPYGPAAIAAAPSGGQAEVVECWTAAEFALYVGARVVRRGPNPYGVIPFVHVPNFPAPNSFWGRSDLVDVVEVNRELEARVSDQADVIRMHADPPVVFKGVDGHGDLAVGPGTVWDVPADADVKLLEWQGEAPAVDTHIERVFRALYEVSETPRTAFGDSGRLLSGVALETELRPIIQKTLRRRVFWTRALRQRNRLILRLAELYGVGGARPGSFAPYRSRVVWPPMVPKDDAQDVQSNVSLVAAGLRSHRSAMDALGTESPEEELERVVADRAVLGVPDAQGTPEVESELGDVDDEQRPRRPVGRPREGRAGE